MRYYMKVVLYSNARCIFTSLQAKADPFLNAAVLVLSETNDRFDSAIQGEWLYERTRYCKSNLR